MFRSVRRVVPSSPSPCNHRSNGRVHLVTLFPRCGGLLVHPVECHARPSFDRLRRRPELLMEFSDPFISRFGGSTVD